MKNIEKSTDELCDIIVSKIGIPLPTYDYESRKYETSIPGNINEDGCVKGVMYKDLLDTFRNACFRIIYWHIEEFPNEKIM